MNTHRFPLTRSGVVALVLGGLASQTVLAQSSPFDTGANSFVAWALTFATPIAVLVVIGTGAAAAFGRISWGWAVGAIVGIAVIFGSEQIVAWIRSLFGV
jgi:type IV secretion system protein VirB2